MGHESQIEPWSPLDRDLVEAGFLSEEKEFNDSAFERLSAKAGIQPGSLDFGDARESSRYAGYQCPL